MSSTVTLQTDSVIYKLGIGTGASSVVYKAIDKRTGEYRAAKVIKDRSKYNQLDLNREITTLKKLNHSNIVKLYSKETEISTGRDVLILEYCQTSLYSFLQEPENSHGLRDQEFLLLLLDVASGLQYLHSNGIIHRDLKPGNILRKIKPDVSPKYIISDFGTSRKLENPEEEYFSLVGTEEFLHPNVYQKAFIDKKQASPFNSGTDLWSFGCTLFQAISSRMPFIPFDGARNDRKIMFKMLACKPPGCISAYQNSPGGDLIWENRFPEHCPMSSNLQEIMRGIISSLMEADSRKQISYEELFKTKQRLSSMFRLEVHLTSDGTTQTFYLDPSISFADLQEQIAMYTDIPAGRQLLFYNDQILENLIQKNFDLTKLLHQPPVMNSLTLTVKQIDQEIASYSIEPFPVYHNTNTINKDYQVTSKRCEIVNNIMLLVLQSLSFQQNITKTISAMWIMLKTYILKVEKNYEWMKETEEQNSYQLEILNLIHKTSRRHNLVRTQGLFSKRGHKKTADDSEELKNMTEQMKSKLESIQECLVELNTNSSKYLHDSQIAFDTCTSDCCKKAERYKEKMKVILNRMKMSKPRLKEIPTEEENIQHLHDKSEAAEVCAASLAMWQDHCWIQKQKSFHRFKRYERIFYECQEKCKKAKLMMFDLRSLRNRIKDMFFKIYSNLPDNIDDPCDPKMCTLFSNGVNGLDLEDDMKEHCYIGDDPRAKIFFPGLESDDLHQQMDQDKIKTERSYFSVDDGKYLASKEKRGVGSIPAEEQDKRHVTNKSRLMAWNTCPNCDDESTITQMGK